MEKPLTTTGYAVLGSRARCRRRSHCSTATVRVGLSDAQLGAVASREDIAKLSARDLAPAVARGVSGATTVAATAHVAARAGIGVFATGGLGGVHREAQDTWDESADLVALSRTRICVVCSGVKSILDVPATLERLETLGVAVAGYGTIRFPGFYLADSGHPAPWRLDSPAEVAAALRARDELGGRERARGRQPARRGARPGAARARARRGAGGRGRAGDPGARRHPVPARALPRADRWREPARERAAGVAQRRAGGAHRGGGGQMTSVIVVGDLMADVVATITSPLAHASDTPAEIVRRPGGGGANVAARLAAAGVPTLLVARVGEDSAGQAAIAELRDGGVELEIAIDARRPTGTCIVIVEPGGERTMLPDRGANAALEPADLPIDEFTGGKHLHLSGYTLLDPGSRWAGWSRSSTRARRGCRSRSTPPPPRRRPRLGRLPGLVRPRRAAAPERRGGHGATGARDPEAAAWALAKDGREVVITLGKEGALWSDGERVEREGEPGAGARRLDRRRRRVHRRLARCPAQRGGGGGGAGRGQLRRGAGAEGGRRALKGGGRTRTGSARPRRCRESRTSR